MTTAQASTDRSHALRGADLRRRDLAGARFEFVSLEQARFDAADLTGATFRHVDLTNASFRTARLEHATFQFVRAGAADLRYVHAADVCWERSSLVGARFEFSDLRRARLVSCGLERVSFDDADLSLASLAWSSLVEASLGGTNLDHAQTLGVELSGAHLRRARNVAYCREIVIELLRTNLDRDLEAMKWLGAISQLRLWCYPAWAELLRDEPAWLDTAAAIFRRYPASGCAEALEAAIERTTAAVNGARFARNVTRSLREPALTPGSARGESARRDGESAA